MDGNIIGYSDRGIYSATLTDEVKDALNQMNQGNNNNNSSDGSGSTDNPDNIITSGGQEKPPYFHPPYVI